MLHPHPPRSRPPRRPPALPPSLRATLRRARRDGHPILVAGIGHELRGDDAVGLTLIRALRHALPRDRRRARVRLLEAGSAPENLTGHIARLLQPPPTATPPAAGRRPSPLILLLDAAELGQPPATTALIDPARITGPGFSSHNLPLSVFMHYLAERTGARVLLLGLQPVSTAFGAPLSADLASLVPRLTRGLRNALA